MHLYDIYLVHENYSDSKDKDVYTLQRITMIIPAWFHTGMSSVSLAEPYQSGATSHEHPSKYYWVQSIDVDIEHGEHPRRTQQESEQSVREPETPGTNNYDGWR